MGWVIDKFGLYRDDGIAAIKSTSGPINERLSKKLKKVFQKHQLEITIEKGLVKTDFLDVTLNLRNDMYEPYRKPRSETIYVHKKSNHPNYIVKQIPNTINDRLTRLSRNEFAFNNAKENYQEALTKAGYEHELKFERSNSDDEKKKKKRKKKRKRKNVIFFNPPFCKTVATGIGRSFLDMVDRNFGINHPYHKIFNRKTLKISYSCMPNVKSRIMAHNRRILQEMETSEERSCNCRNKNNCPVSNKCLTTNIVYKATVTSSNEVKCYVGSSGLSFKDRYTKHKHSFSHRDKRNVTVLANYIWKLKDNNTDFTLKWEILSRTKNKYNERNGCKLCNMEKIEISNLNSNESLNARTELQSGCIHYRNMFL